MDNNVREHEARVSAGLSLFNEHLSGTWSSEYILSVTSAFKSTGHDLGNCTKLYRVPGLEPGKHFYSFCTEKCGN